MKKNSRNTDLLDTMKLPVIRPKPVKEDKYSYDGSYDKHNDPESKLAHKIEKRLKSQRIPKASAKKKPSTDYHESAKRPSAPSYQTYSSPYVEDFGPTSNDADYYEDDNAIDTRAIVAIVMAIIFLAIGAIIFYVIATNFGYDRSANTPATTAVTEETTVAPQETTEATTEVTTESTTAEETTTETTTEQTTEPTTEVATTQMPTEPQTEAPIITQPEVIVTNPPAPTEAQTQPEPETEAPTEEYAPSDIQDLDPATPGVQGAW